MSRLTYTDLATFKGTKTWESERLNDNGVDAVGCFRLPHSMSYFNLFPIEQWEKDSFLKDTIQKDGCKMFRYQTSTSKIGGFAPIISVNMTSGLVYFNTGEDVVAFEKISEKPIFIDINLTQK